MTRAKHKKVPPQVTSSDLARDPGIGRSKGTTRAGADADLLDEESRDATTTFEGDVENEATLGGGADPRRVGRRNR
jgi:hypothetical protein